MAEYLLGKADDIPEGRGRAFRAGSKTVAVFRAQGKFYAIANRCIHKGASMCDGRISDGDAVVRCPWHNWPFDLATGESCLDRSEKLRTFEVKLDGDRLILSA